jgi:hypothetical protein
MRRLLRYDTKKFAHFGRKENTLPLELDDGVCTETVGRIQHRWRAIANKECSR